MHIRDFQPLMSYLLLLTENWVIFWIQHSSQFLDKVCNFACKVSMFDCLPDKWTARSFSLWWSECNASLHDMKVNILSVLGSSIRKFIGSSIITGSQHWVPRNGVIMIPVALSNVILTSVVLFRLKARTT